MSVRRIFCKLPDGSFGKRETHKRYTHVVAVFYNGQWRAGTWHTSLVLAKRALRGRRPEDARIVLVDP